MNAQEAADKTESLRTEVRTVASRMSQNQRATLLREVVKAVYDSVKFDNPEGGGLDGRDGPERQSLGLVGDAAENHFYAALDGFKQRQED